MFTYIIYSDFNGETIVDEVYSLFDIHSLISTLTEVEGRKVIKIEKNIS